MGGVGATASTSDFRRSTSPSEQGLAPWSFCSGELGPLCGGVLLSAWAQRFKGMKRPLNTEARPRSTVGSGRSGLTNVASAAPPVLTRLPAAAMADRAPAAAPVQAAAAAAAAAAARLREGPGLAPGAGVAGATGGEGSGLLSSRLGTFSALRRWGDQRATWPRPFNKS